MLDDRFLVFLLIFIIAFLPYLIIRFGHKNIEKANKILKFTFLIWFTFLFFVLYYQNLKLSENIYEIQNHLGIRKYHKLSD